MESGLFRTISSSSIRNFLPKSISSKKKSSSNPKSPNATPNDENAIPSDPNIPLSYGPSSPTVPKQSPSDALKFQPEMARLDGQKQEPGLPDPPVKVVVRIRPAIDGQKEGDQTLKKVSADTVAVEDRKFTFDSVFDSKAKQVDIFQTVGVPLVKSALAGYNTSILSYGESGSGKTYTMWGPPSAMVEDPYPASHQGIVPRIFQMLFSDIEKEQVNCEGKQINYQCRCSFLEIFNEEIGDLLDPTQRNLKIKDDAKNGLYVENLTEEYVTSYDDVMQFLIKGLSSRKVGATSVNSKSSRSHIVFTFIIESWCKGTSSKCFGSSKTSRMCLVDLAGLDRNKADDAGGQSLKAVKNVKKSLSRLGHLVNDLAKGSHYEKSEDALYRSSCLTHLLKESLGGNSKLTVLCTIVPYNSNNGEVLRTLRFGERMKSIRNNPVINEITEDDVNGLSDQIRQLKEELIRAKSSSTLENSRNEYFQGRNVRESLNQLRVSLNRSLLLPHIDNDSDEEMAIDEDDMRELREQLDELHNSSEGKPSDQSLNKDSMQLGESCEDSASEDAVVFPEETEIEELYFDVSENEFPHKEAPIALTDDIPCSSNTLWDTNPESRSILIGLSCKSPILQEPTMSESPKFGKNLRKSVAFSSSYGVCQSNVSGNAKIESDELRNSLSKSSCIRSSLQSSKKLAGPTESLAASLQRGLKIIDCHHQNSASNKSPLAFSFEHLMLKPCPEVDEAENDSSKTFLCASCRKCIQGKEVNDVQDINQMKEIATKDTSSSMDEVTKRDELEKHCAEQAAHIEELNKLIEQYKQEKHNSTEEYCHDINVPYLSSKNEIVLFEDAKDEVQLSRCGSVDNHRQEIIKENYEIKEIQNESIHGYGSAFFDVNEKDELLKEIQILRSKLQSQTNASTNMSTEKLRSSLLSRSIQLRKSGAYQNFSEEELEKERQRWTETESEWISLTDELRIDIDTHRRRAENLEMELKLEKKSTEELDDALGRAVLGHARFVEHYVELQERYNDLVEKHASMMGVIAEVKRAALKAGKKGQGSRFAKTLAAELSAVRVEREREREILKKENKNLKIQLRDTAEAVHAAGELLVRLREAEHAASTAERTKNLIIQLRDTAEAVHAAGELLVRLREAEHAVSTAEENFTKVHEDNEKLKKQMEKLKRKHKMEMITMKQYIAESKLPESALQPMYREDSDLVHDTMPDDDQAWRAEFGAIYQQHY